MKELNCDEITKSCRCLLLFAHLSHHLLGVMLKVWSINKREELMKW